MVDHRFIPTLDHGCSGVYPSIEWHLDTLTGRSIKVDVNWDEIPEEVKPKVDVIVNLVMTMLVSIIDNEDQINLKVCANHRRMMMTVTIHDDDVGYALGVHGTNASALRTILIAACKKLKFHFELDICGASGSANWSSTRS